MVTRIKISFLGMEIIYKAKLIFYKYFIFYYKPFSLKIFLFNETFSQLAKKKNKFLNALEESDKLCKLR